jgi:hypothetical protein
MRHRTIALAVATALLALTATPALAEPVASDPPASTEAPPSSSPATGPGSTAPSTATSSPATSAPSHAPAARTAAPAARVSGPSGIGSPSATGPIGTNVWVMHAYETVLDHRVLQYRWNELTPSLGVTDLGGYSVDGVGAVMLGRTPESEEGFYAELVFVRGRDNAIWFRESQPDKGTWLPWRSLGGTFTARPAALAVGETGVAVYARGTDGFLYQRARGPRGWAPRWTRLGQRLTGGPAGGGQTLAVRGPDDRLRTASLIYESSTDSSRFHLSAWTLYAIPPFGVAAEPGIGSGVYVVGRAGILQVCDPSACSISPETRDNGRRFRGAVAWVHEQDFFSGRNLLTSRGLDGRLIVENVGVPAPPPGSATPQPLPRPAPAELPAAAPPARSDADLPATGPAGPVRGLLTAAALLLLTGALAAAAARRTR